MVASLFTTAFYNRLLYLSIDFNGEKNRQKFEICAESRDLRALLSEKRAVYADLAQNMRVVTGCRCPVAAFFATTERRTPRRGLPLRRAGCAGR
nr:MAG TPA_asm: hypothetical protein [Caudoviricetes sp.]